MPQFIGLKGVSENKISVMLFILIYSSGLQSFWVKYLHMCSLVKPRKYNYGEHNKVEDNDEIVFKSFLSSFEKKKPVWSLNSYLTVFLSLSWFACKSYDFYSLILKSKQLEICYQMKRLSGLLKKFRAVSQNTVCDFGINKYLSHLLDYLDSPWCPADSLFLFQEAFSSMDIFRTVTMMLFFSPVPASVST